MYTGNNKGFKTMPGGLQLVTLVYVFGFSYCAKGLVNPVAFYPFNDEHKASDISCHRNKEGSVVGATLTAGPNGMSNNGYDFTQNNFIELPGISSTDTRYSMTLLLWVYHAGFSGPVVDYATDGLGVNLWMTGKDTLYGRIISRDGATHQFLSSNQIGLQYSWHYVGMSYDYSTGNAILWVDGISVQQSYVGTIQLKTAGLIRIGALSSDDRFFRGKISCLQIYNKALTAPEVLTAKRRCKKQALDCSEKETTECGGLMLSQSGTITSPQYPREYPPNTRCIWKLDVPNRRIIILRFRNIDLEKESFSCGDYIEVFDGFNTWSTRLIKYCKSPSKKELQLVSTSNKMRIEFKSNSDSQGKGFTASYISEPVRTETQESGLDLSVHYTGIVIGVACAALLAALTIIAINHSKQSRRRRSSTLSSRHTRRSESFSATDIVAQGAPPSYDIVMRCPELYPPSPQMTPASSTAGRIVTFRAPQQISAATSSKFARDSDSSSDESDIHDPPPYPGNKTTQREIIQSQRGQTTMNDAEQADSQTVPTINEPSNITIGNHSFANSQEDIEQRGHNLVNDNLSSCDLTDNCDPEQCTC